MYIFLFDIAHLKRFETIQLHVLSTFKIVKKTIFFLFRRCHLYKLSLHIYFVI